MESTDGRVPGPPPPPAGTALQILEDRYAQGEIDREEFLQRKQDLPAGRQGPAMATHRRSGLVTAGIVLIAVGVAALGVLLAFALPTDSPLYRYTPRDSSGHGSYGLLGERIYFTGTDKNGRPIPRSGGIGMMSRALGCADCHGPDGRGRTVGAMMGSFEAPDIRWSTLTSPQDPDGQHQTPFDEAGFSHAVRDGIDPEGQRLKSPMPLWQVSDQEVQDLVAYLKTL